MNIWARELRLIQGNTAEEGVRFYNTNLNSLITGVKAGEAKTGDLYKSNFLLKVVPSFAYSLLLSLYLSLSVTLALSITRLTYAHAFPSSLADRGLRHKLVLKVADGETFVSRALLDASTWGRDTKTHTNHEMLRRQESEWNYNSVSAEISLYTLSVCFELCTLESKLDCNYKKEPSGHLCMHEKQLTLTS